MIISIPRKPIGHTKAYVIWNVPGESTLSKALDDIIVGRISRMINFVDEPESLLEQLDNLRYFVEKKIAAKPSTYLLTYSVGGDKGSVRNE